MKIFPFPFLSRMSFRTRLFLGLILPVFAVQCISITHELLDHQEHFIESLETERDLALHFVSQALARPMWDYDTSQIENLVHSILTEGRTARVQIFDASDTLIYGQQSPDYQPAGNDLKASQQISYSLGEQQHVLGRLELTHTLSTVTALMNDAMMGHIRTSFFVLGVIGLVIYMGHPYTTPNCLAARRSPCEELFLSGPWSPPQWLNP